VFLVGRKGINTFKIQGFLNKDLLTLFIISLYVDLNNRSDP
jgi:hypothetical protein